jgi:Holliday junction resolvasome RuvABC DNA-binding subunit
MKESFRVYRKKAKEIFEAQQNVGNGGISSAAALHITSNSSADAKLAYLKNLMINYLSSAPGVRGHMEGAIATVLQFSDHEINQMAKKKADSESWF